MGNSGFTIIRHKIFWWAGGEEMILTVNQALAPTKTSVSFKKDGAE